MKTGPQLEVSSDRLVKPGSEPTALAYKACGLFTTLQRFLSLIDLRPYYLYINISDPWSTFWGSFLLGLNSQSTVETVMSEWSVSPGQASARQYLVHTLALVNDNVPSNQWKEENDGRK